MTADKLRVPPCPPGLVCAVLLRRKGLKMKAKAIDLTQGKSVKLIISYAMPILLGQIFQNLYNSVDSMVAGNFAGTTALAAISSCSDISNLLVGFFTGLSTGAGVLFARFYGAKDYKKLHDSIHTTLTFSTILGAVMAAAGILFAPLLLKVVACPPDVWGEALLYLRIYLVGILFTSIYNVASGVLRAVGNSRDPFIYLVIASCTNIALDLLLVGALQMGVAGAAIATIVSQLLSVFLVFWNMVRTRDVYRVIFRDLKYMDKALLLEVLDLGLPAAMQTALITISHLFVQRYINQFGAQAMAGIGAAKKVDKYVGLISNSIGLSLTNFISQNLGAGRRDRAFRGVRICLVMNAIAVAAVGTPVYFFAPVVLRLFTSDPQTLAYGAAMVTVMMPLYYLQALLQIFSNAMRGFGRSRMVMALSILGLVVGRQIYLAIAMSLDYTVANIYVSYPVGWGLAAGLCILYYFLTVRRAPHPKKAAVS